MHKASCSPGLHILFVLLYSQSSWWHVVKEWGVRELREALLQLSPVKEKTSRVWVQGLTSVGILACVQIVRWVQKEWVISRFSLCCLGACQCALVNEFIRVWPPSSTFEVTSCRFICICINRLISWLKLNGLVGIISQKFKALWQLMSLVYFSFFQQASSLFKSLSSLTDLPAPLLWHAFLALVSGLIEPFKKQKRAEDRVNHHTLRGSEGVIYIFSTYVLQTSGCNNDITSRP